MKQLYNSLLLYYDVHFVKDDVWSSTSPVILGIIVWQLYEMFGCYTMMSTLSEKYSTMMYNYTCVWVL